MTDAHCHPWALLDHCAAAEEERRKTGTAAAASSSGLEEFEYHEGLARKAREDGAPPLIRCFALHPQISGGGTYSCREGLELLVKLGAEGRLDAIGEAGFDLYDEHYRAGEKIQDEMFIVHLETALKHELPMIIHIRRAMHKIFPFSKQLKKIPAVVFHSWPGTRGEGEALLNRGINAYFSFGTTVVKNHRKAQISAASFPLDRITLETDAPYQPLRGKEFSVWQDLEIICRGIAALRKEAGSPGNSMEEVEAKTTENFFKVFKK